MSKNFNRMINILTAAIVCAAMLTLTCFSAFAADLKVNDKSVKTGDIVTYSIYFSGAEKKASAINAKIIYDESVLALIAGDESNSAIVFGDVFGGAVIYNEVRHQDFLFNAANGVSGYSFKDETPVISLSFEVLETANPETAIEYEIIEFLDMNVNEMSEGKDYKVTAKTEVNVYNGDKTLVDKTKPSVNANSSEETSTVSQNSSGGTSNSNTTIVIIVVVIIVLIAAAALIIVFSSKNSNSKK